MDACISTDCSSCSHTSGTSDVYMMAWCNTWSVRWLDGVCCTVDRCDVVLA